MNESTVLNIFMRRNAPLFLRWMILVSACWLAKPLFAQPDLSQKASTALLEQDSSHYSFETLKIAAKSNGQRYRVYLAIPKGAVPAHGYPVIYMLDGNAVLDALNEPLLKDISATEPPVIVMIGYETEARFDTTARAYDYTPPIPDEKDLEDVPGSDRRAGGAVLFLDFIEQQVKAEVMKRVRIDSKRQTLWGHSYGGLFVLHTLFTCPNCFQRYVAVSPSLWWHEGFILGEGKLFNDHALTQDTKLVVMVGTDEAKPKNERATATEAPDKKVQETQQARSRLRSAVPAGSAQKMVARLNQKRALVRELP